METSLVFDDNALMTELLGDSDAHISAIEQQCDVDIHSRGSALVISGEQDENVKAGRDILSGL